MQISLSLSAWALALPLCAAVHTWSNVKIGGGGGFVPGIVFNSAVKGVAYARTDIGGLYKLNSDDSWTPLTDAITQSTSWHNWGIDAVATDPIDSKRVYAAVGMYSNSWDPNNGAIIRSSDGGATWQSTALSFKVGGNMPGRGMGERLAIDPQNNKIIYFGARSGNGLWKSTDQGATFTKVSSFTAVGTYAQDPTDTNGYLNDIQGLAWITFDSTSGLTGGATSRIFVGVADKGNSVFVSTDAGATWNAVAGQPTGNLPHKCKLQPTEKALYLTYSNTSGPYDGGTGSVQRYDLTSSTWADISPVTAASGNLYFGYGGLGVDIQKPGTLMVASLNSWWPDAQIFRSNDSGKTWSPIWEWTSYPNRNLYYGYSTPKAPWITADRASDDTKQLGWMIEALEIDPFDSNHWLYGTGLTLYGGHDLTKWDTAHNITIQSLADGIEEEAVQDLASVPGGPALLAATSDVGGFTFKTTADLKTSPAQGWLTPGYASNTGVDYAGNKPASVVRVGNANDGTQQVAVSSDGGQSWSIDYGSQGGQYGGKVAYSADADTVVWSSASSGVLVSQYSGTFSAVSSLPSGAAIASDKRNGTVFYGGSAGAFYASKDTGKTFTKTVTLSGATAVRSIAVNPTLAGDVWVSTDVGVFHSTDSGTSFTKVSTITSGYDIALGKGTGSYGWNVYVFGTGAGGDKLYASADQGSSWVDIQGTQGFGSISANAVGASPDTAGLVFVGTNGRGVFYGQGTVSGGSTTPVSSSSSAVASTSTRSSSVAISTSTPRTTAASTLTTSTTSHSSAAASPSATGAAVQKYGQCGGSGGQTSACVSGSTCQKQNDFYWQCL